MKTYRLLTLAAGACLSATAFAADPAVQPPQPIVVHPAVAPQPRVDAPVAAGKMTAEPQAAPAPTAKRGHPQAGKKKVARAGKKVHKKPLRKHARKAKHSRR